MPIIVVLLMSFFILTELAAITWLMSLQVSKALTWWARVLLAIPVGLITWHAFAGIAIIFKYW